MSTKKNRYFLLHILEDHYGHIVWSRQVGWASGYKTYKQVCTDAKLHAKGLDIGHIAIIKTIAEVCRNDGIDGVTTTIKNLRPTPGSP
jgi:hypothetical protein